MAIRQHEFLRRCAAHHNVSARRAVEAEAFACAFAGGDDFLLAQFLDEAIPEDLADAVSANATTYRDLHRHAGRLLAANHPNMAVLEDLCGTTHGP